MELNSEAPGAPGVDAELELSGAWRGGAVIPPLFGLLADKVGIQYAFVLPIICYIFIAYYGLIGYKPTRAA